MKETAYITADAIGTETGGGVVTRNESQALRELGGCRVYARNGGDHKIECMGNVDPWGWDEQLVVTNLNRPKLAHFYAGTFSKTIDLLKCYGTKIVYTAAAHSIEKSRKAHEDAGFQYNYPHLLNPDLWKRYVAGYLAANVVVCPSEHSARCMREYGCERIVVIPHGIDLPEESVVRPIPKTFTCGYLGSCGSPDKGVKYLLQAWGKLNYKDAVLVLAGRDSTSPYVQQLINQYAGYASVITMGWVKNIADFYNSISLYVQPSITEGFGIEVLEALSYKRPVICSTGAGAVDLVPMPYNQSFSHEEGSLADKINYLKKNPSEVELLGQENREVAENYTWSKIRARYQEVWKGLLNV